MLKNLLKGYSIAEALVTMAIIAIVFVVVAPSIMGKKPKITSFVQAITKHGVYTCNSGTCNFSLPEGVKNIYVIAVGAGGGGAGASCGEEGKTIQGEKDKDVEGLYEYVPNRTLYMSGSGAGGGSSQLSGDCDAYRPADTFSTAHAPGGHDYECNVWYSKRVRQDYKEAFTINKCIHKYWENVNHPYSKWVEECKWVSTTECSEYNYTKVKDPITGVETSVKGTCKTYKQEQKCTDVLRRFDNWYEEWVYRSEPCWESGDSNIPRTYYHTTNGSSYITQYISYCDRNQSLPTVCKYDSGNNYWGGSPHIGTDMLWKEDVVDIHSRETERTGRADVCQISWLKKPEISPPDGQNRPNRYCNAAVFGGKGGSGELYYRRTCPIPGNSKCTKYREAHSIPSGCSQTMISQRGMADGCEKIIYTKPASWQDKEAQALGDKCGAWSIQARLMSEGKCGHRYNAYNCNIPHEGAVSKTCIEWDKSAKSIAYTIGYQGKAGKPLGTKGRDTYLNRPTSAAGGIPQFGAATIAGGEGGPMNRHGSNRGGRAGGGHTGYSGEYSAYPRYHTQDGQVGWLGFAVKYIKVGQGGKGGLTKAGYFKNVEGPVVITVGAPGKGGKGGAVGSKGGQTVVKARSGGFNIFYDVPSGEDSPTGGEGNNSNAGTDKGPGDGTLFISKGGDGGTHRKQYETCSVSGSSELFDPTSNIYTGGQGYASEFEGYGRGGDGNGGKVPDCAATDGKDGQSGGVIIFY